MQKDARRDVLSIRVISVSYDTDYCELCTGPTANFGSIKSAVTSIPRSLLDLVFVEVV